MKIDLNAKIIATVFHSFIITIKAKSIKRALWITKLESNKTQSLSVQEINCAFNDYRKTQDKN